MGTSVTILFWYRELAGEHRSPGNSPPEAKMSDGSDDDFETGDMMPDKQVRNYDVSKIVLIQIRRLVSVGHTSHDVMTSQHKI